MTRSDLALWVAIASAAFTASGLIWQLILFPLSGSRLDVRLTPAVLDDMGTLLRGPEPGFTVEVPREMRTADSVWSVDLAEVTVVNVGRLAVSVDDVSLDLGRPRYWRRARHTVRGRPIAVHGARTEEVIRLEPGAMASVLFDFWPLVGRGEARWRSVRASVRQAGRKRRRSRWRRRWVLDLNHRSLRPWVQVTPLLRGYRTLWRHLLSPNGEPGPASLAWMSVQGKLTDDAPLEGVQEALEPFVDQPVGLTAFKVLEAFQGIDWVPPGSTTDRSIG